MKRSARSRKEPSGVGGLMREGFAITGGALMRNPLAVGGTTAFIVTLAYVSANALWYQPYAHPAAYFATRVTIAPPPAPERFTDPTPVPLQRPKPAPGKPDDLGSMAEQEPTTASVNRGDDDVRLVQEVLKTLDLYAGPVDGLTGPQTAKAVERYQKIVGLEPNGRIDAKLMQQLGAGSDSLPALASNEAVAVPAPRPAAAQPAKPLVQQAVVQASDPKIVRIQAGLRAFGHDGIELDGVVGARTRAAIKEFQSLFGLPETGEPDDGLYAKMREVGLTD